jgi:hypothetical protein
MIYGNTANACVTFLHVAKVWQLKYVFLHLGYAEA